MKTTQHKDLDRSQLFLVRLWAEQGREESSDSDSASPNAEIEWNGSAWSPLTGGVDGSVLGIAITGSNVYATGGFQNAGGVPAVYVKSVARWDGSAWHPLGIAPNVGVNGTGSAVAIGGGQVYVAGHFDSAGGIPAKNVAGWDGSSWSSLGGGVEDDPKALAVVGGGDVYVGGIFVLPANHIARWDGITWQGLGSGTDSDVHAIGATNLDIYVGGTFGYAGGKRSSYVGLWHAPVQPTVTPTPTPMATNTPGPPLCTVPSFAAATNFGVGNSPLSGAVGDFNRDNNPDLAAANSASANVSVLLGNGSGGFSAATNFGAGFGPVSVAVGDFNRDGNPDLAAANAGDGATNVSVLLGNGSGGFGAATTFGVGEVPHSVAVGDFNRDGNPDLATANYTPSNNRSSVSVLLGNGSGGFSATPSLGAGNAPYSVVVGDFNRDSNPDLAVSNFYDSNVSVLLGNGSGGFSAATNFGVGNSPYSVAVGDFNRDGNPDLAAANYGSSSNDVSVLLGNGSGGFSAATNFGAGSNPSSMAVGDFNRDGNPDLAAANYGSSNVSVLLGNGSGGFSAATNFGVGASPGSVAVGDFNRDGSPDLATANTGSNNVSVLLNTCGSAIPTATPTPAPSCAVQYTDVPPGNTFYPFVMCLACRGLISGYPCGADGEPCDANNNPYFRPNANVTRGQIAKIVSNAAGYTEDPNPQIYEDVDPTNPFYAWVNRLSRRGHMSGYPCGSNPCIPPDNRPYFLPFNQGTRGQLSKIVSNAAGFSDTPVGQIFSDIAPDNGFYVWIQRLASRGIIGGYSCGGAGEPCDSENRPYFRPGNAVTRGQVAKIASGAFYPNCQTPALK